MQHRRRAGIGPAPQLHPWTVSVAQLHEAPRYGQRIRVDLALAAAVPVFLHRSSSHSEYRDHSLVEPAFEVACSSDRRACSLGVMERGPLPTPWVGKRRGTPAALSTRVSLPCIASFKCLSRATCSGHGGGEGVGGLAQAGI